MLGIISIGTVLQLRALIHCGSCFHIVEEFELISTYTRELTTGRYVVLYSTNLVDKLRVLTLHQHFRTSHPTKLAIQCCISKANLP